MASCPSPWTDTAQHRAPERKWNMNDLKLVLWPIPKHQIPTEAGSLQILDIDFANSVPELFDHLNNGWEIVNHNFVGMTDGGGMITLFLRKPVVVPDNAAGA